MDTNLQDIKMKFDARNIQQKTVWSPVPKGWYPAKIESVEWDSYQGGVPNFKLTLRVLEGEFKGRYVWATLNLFDPSRQRAYEVSQRLMSGLCHATDILVLNNVDDYDKFEGKTLQIQVGITSSKNTGNEYNVVNNYSKLEMTA